MSIAVDAASRSDCRDLGWQTRPRAGRRPTVGRAGCDERRVLVPDVEVGAVPGEPDDQVRDGVEQGPLPQLALAVEAHEQGQRDGGRGKAPRGNQQGLEIVGDR